MEVVYKINGKVVSKQKFRAGSKGSGNIRLPYTSSTIQSSEGAAVHPKDRAAAEEHARKHGFSIDFDSEGRPNFSGNRQKRAYLKTIGMFNHDDNS
jgi:hypothetical protein